MCGAHMLCWLQFAECVKSSGVEYRGTQQSSSSGLTCLNWTNTARDYDVNLHPDSQTGKQLALICLLIQRSANVPQHVVYPCCLLLEETCWRVKNVMLMMLIGATVSLKDITHRVAILTQHTLKLLRHWFVYLWCQMAYFMDFLSLCSWWPVHCSVIK